MTPIERPPSKATLDTSRRYRAAHPDRIQAYQRDYRARVKAEVIELREERAS